MSTKATKKTAANETIPDKVMRFEFFEQCVERLTSKGWERDHAVEFLRSSVRSALEDASQPQSERRQGSIEDRDQTGDGVRKRLQFAQIVRGLVNENGWNETRAHSFVRGLFRGNLAKNLDAVQAIAEGFRVDGIELAPALSPGKTWRRLVRVFLEEWHLVTLGAVLILIANVSHVAYPSLTGKAIDAVAKNQGQSEFVKILLLSIVSFCVAAGARSASSYLSGIMGARIISRMRKRIFDSLLMRDISFFDTMTTGDLMSRLSADTSVIQDSAATTLPNLISELVKGIAALVIMFFISPKLTIITIIAVPLTSFCGVWFGKKLEAHSKQFLAALSQAAHIAEQAISGIRTIRTLNNESFESRRFGKAVDASYSVAEKRERTFAGFRTVLALGDLIVSSAIFGFGGLAVLNGEISMGELTSYLLYMWMASGAMNELSAGMGSFLQAAGSAERLFFLMGDEKKNQPAIPAPQAVPVMDAARGHLQFQRVSFAYPSRVTRLVLQDMSFEALPGETTALVGISGGGKSTIFSLLARLYEPTAGQILFDGKPISKVPREWLLSQLALVDQFPFLLADTIQANIAYGCEGKTFQQIEAAAKLAQAHDFISNFPKGYETIVGDRGVMLSGGQRQRIAIARALLRESTVLLLDEATSALDPESESRLQEALHSVRSGRTTLVIAHRLSTVRNAARVIVLNQGRVEESGTHDELMKKNGMYRKLVEQSKLGVIADTLQTNET